MNYDFSKIKSEGERVKRQVQAGNRALERWPGQSGDGGKSAR